MPDSEATVPDRFSMTFYFNNGQNRTFDIYLPDDFQKTSADRRQLLRRFLNESWWIVQTPEETVFIHSANVLTVEINPPLPQLEGEGILQAESVSWNRFQGQDRCLANSNGSKAFGRPTGYLKSGWRDSNPRPLRPERSALPTCATSRYLSRVTQVRPNI